MSGALVLTLVSAAVAIAALARRYGLPSPLVLVAAGLAASFIPGLPSIELDPDLVLYGVLPPLLFSASLDSSYMGLRANIRPVALLSVGLVLFTTVAVGAAAYLVSPTLGWPLALVLGAVVSPPDAVAATAIGRTLALPRRVLTVLGGESLLNDATALTAYRVAVAWAVGGTLSVGDGLATFGLAVGVGVAVGLVLGFGAALVLRWLSDASVEVAVFLLVPFAAYALAEEAHGSGVLAVVAAGLWIGRQQHRMHYSTRLQGGSVVTTVDFVLETVVFGLIGLQLPAVISSLGDRPVREVVVLVTVVVAVVLVTRIVWIFPATYLPRRLSRRIRERDPVPPVGNIVVLSWAGMRGVVTLGAAFALPLRDEAGQPLPGRDLVLFAAFAVVVATLMVQGLSLPWLIRRLHLGSGEERDDALAEAQAAQEASDAAMSRLDELADDEEGQRYDGIVQELREMATARANAAWERLGPQGPHRSETPSEFFRRLRRDMLASERAVYVRYRDEGRIDDEVLRRVQRELDLEEARLSR
ncbi:Na+/H+ antiporter [Nakamurella endophytica]|uniref:Na+/H+ antiporter n=1 Tax=Nakamurella endophytica TaxID=1748367 RepID=A0A917SY28_9ACTN|nr:Na+/H+ antiporter [Nakamurella endophytica]GGM00500.1 putative Na+/H+ antiporter [Nakamurella endophytica]